MLNFSVPANGQIVGGARCGGDPRFVRSYVNFPPGGTFKLTDKGFGVYTGTYVPHVIDNSGYGCYWPGNSVSPQYTVAAPQITRVSPTGGKPGQTTTVTVTGSGFIVPNSANTPAATDAKLLQPDLVTPVPNVSVSLPSVQNNSTATVQVNTGAGAQPGRYKLALTVLGALVTADFDVQGPPTITTAPPAKVLMGTGGQASITVGASPTDSLRYIWEILTVQPGDDATVIATDPATLPACNNQASCTATIVGGDHGGKATLRVHAVNPTTGQETTADSRVVVIQFVQVTATVAATVGQKTDGTPTQDSPPPHTFDFPRGFGVGALPWPADPSWPEAVVLLENTGFSVSASTIPPASDPDVTVSFAGIRAPDDAGYVGKANLSATGNSIALSQRGSFLILAYIDTNQNGVRDNVESGFALPVVVAEVLANSGFNSSVAQSGNLGASFQDMSSTMEIDAGINNINARANAGVDLRARLDIVCGGADGRRGIGQISAGWVHNETQNDAVGLYTPNAHVFSWVPIRNPQDANGHLYAGFFPMFLPTDPSPPLLWALPLLDTSSPGAGAGGASSGFGERQSAPQTTVQDLAYGREIFVEAVDSPSTNFPITHPRFPGSRLVQGRFNLGFQAYVVAWSGSADRSYSVLLAQPWSMNATFNIDATNAVTPQGTPSITLDTSSATVYSPAAPISGYPPKLVPPAIGGVLGVNAQN